MNKVIQSVAKFLQKEIIGADNTINAICAFLKKEEPKAQVIFNAAVADYKVLETATPIIEADLQVLATFIAEIATTL